MLLVGQARTAPPPAASWAVDETLSASGAIHDVTIQWSIIGEGLNHSAHSKGAHGIIDSQKDVGGWPDYRAAGKLPGAPTSAKATVGKR